MTTGDGLQNELARVKRVSDMLCTAHAALRDRFGIFAFVLDLLILAFSTWLVALAFIQPQISMRLTPFNWDPLIWIGTLSTGTFFLTVVQMKTDWKGRADSHKRALEMYAEVKREAGYLLVADEVDELAIRRVLARYELAGSLGVEIPEREFMSQKRRHKLKVALSKHLDTHPSASLLLTRMRFWVRDNCTDRVIA